MRALSIFAIASVLLNCIGTLPANAAKPNILVIVSDDHGYADAGFQGGKDVATPSLDRLAASGVRCTNGYVSHPFCSPTRAGLLTGRYQARFGHEYNPVYDPLDEKEGLPLSERLLPQFLKESGYRTGWIGKWHLGASPSHAPWKRGFDETYGFIGGGHQFLGWTPNERQYTLPLMRQGAPISDVPAHLTEAFGEEAAKFVAHKSEQPWFLYLAFNAPHTPHQPTTEREQKFQHIENVARRKYLAQISLLDDAIGRVLDSIRSNGQTEQTLVFFFSDNGGPVKNGANNGPLRGQKGEVYEGGVRVPFLVSWPGSLPTGVSYQPVVSSLDVFATSLAVAGAKLPSDVPRDSVNLVPYLNGTISSAPHAKHFWRAAQGKALAVREGAWKLIRQQGSPDELYNLEQDLGESSDLLAQQTDVAKQLRQSLESWEAELVSPAFLGSSVKSEDWGPGGANQKQGAPNAKKQGSGAKKNSKN